MHTHTHTAVCKIDSQWKPAVWHRKLSSVLWDELDGWGVGREVQEEGDILYIWLIPMPQTLLL